MGKRFLSLNKRNNSLPKLFDSVEMFRLIHHVKIREKQILNIFIDGMREKECIIDVQCQQDPPFQWESRQASFPTGTVDPLVGSFLSPLNTNDGSIYPIS